MQEDSIARGPGCLFAVGWFREGV